MYDNVTGNNNTLGGASSAKVVGNNLNLVPPPSPPLPPSPPRSPVPTTCYTSTAYVSNPNNSWTVCSANGQSAWISSSRLSDDISLPRPTYYPTAICKLLGYDTVSQIGGNCNNVCGACQNFRVTSCTSPGDQGFGDTQYLDTPGYRYRKQMTGSVSWLCAQFNPPIPSPSPPLCYQQPCSPGSTFVQAPAGAGNVPRHRS